MSVMTRANTDRPKVEPLDTDKIRAAEMKAVNATLSAISDPKARLKKAAAIIKAAQAEIEDHEETATKPDASGRFVEVGRTHTVPGLDTRVKKMALSLALREGARGVSNAIPMTRSGFYQLTEKVLGDPETYEKVSPKTGKTSIKTRYVWPERPAVWDETVAARAAAKGVRLDRTAAVELPKLAAQLYAAQVRIDAAEAQRDALVPLVVASGVSGADVARMIDRHPSRVSHLVTAAAAKQ